MRVLFDHFVYRKIHVLLQQLLSLKSEIQNTEEKIKKLPKKKEESNCSLFGFCRQSKLKESSHETTKQELEQEQKSILERFS